MELLLYLPHRDPGPWLDGLARHLPQARARLWQPGDHAPADYALVWRPPAELLRGRTGLKAVFNLAAGVDMLLDMLHAEPDLLPSHVPLIKLDDAGMAAQMIEYVSHAVLRRYRRFDEYEALRLQGQWQALEPNARDAYPVGVMGLGALGVPVAQALVALGFPVRGWSRSRKSVCGVQCFAGAAELGAFADGLRAVINLLPLTPETEGILDRGLFAHLAPGAHLINIARGAHLREDHLLAAIADGRIGRATLDVFREEPLPKDHPFWREPRIDITPHIAALTEREASLTQIVTRIGALERGEAVSGFIDRRRGY